MLTSKLLDVRYPNEVSVTETSSPNSSETVDPAEDDFFASWDKPVIKRPSNQSSRTSSPALGRSSSPLLVPSPGGTTRPKSPLTTNTESDSSNATPPSAPVRTAVRSTTKPGAAKSGILSSKKHKLGAKKAPADEIDFDEAERLAKEEAERIEKMGFEAEAERQAAEAAAAAAAAAPKSSTPVNNSRPESKGRGPATEDVGKIEVGVQRLGFGQVGAGPKPKPGFGATSAPSAVTNGKGERSPNFLSVSIRVLTDQQLMMTV